MVSLLKISLNLPDFLRVIQNVHKKTPWLESASILIPTERPPLDGEVSANFSGLMVSRGQRNDSRPVVNFSFLDRGHCFLEIAPQFSSRG
jgi:hypothetical protein